MRYIAAQYLLTLFTPYLIYIKYKPAGEKVIASPIIVSLHV